MIGDRYKKKNETEEINEETQGQLDEDGKQADAKFEEFQSLIA